MWEFIFSLVIIWKLHALMSLILMLPWKRQCAYLTTQSLKLTSAVTFLLGFTNDLWTLLRYSIYFKFYFFCVFFCLWGWGRLLFEEEAGWKYENAVVLWETGSSVWSVWLRHGPQICLLIEIRCLSVYWLHTCMSIMRAFSGSRWVA